MKTYLSTASGSVDTKENWSCEGWTPDNASLIEVVRIGDGWIEADDIILIEIPEFDEVEECRTFEEIHSLLQEASSAIRFGFIDPELVEERVLYAASYAFSCLDFDDLAGVSTWEEQESTLFNALNFSLEQFHFIDTDWKCEAISIATQMAQVKTHQIKAGE